LLSQNLHRPNPAAQVVVTEATPVVWHPRSSLAGPAMNHYMVRGTNCNTIHSYQHGKRTVRMDITQMAKFHFCGNNWARSWHKQGIVYGTSTQVGLDFDGEAVYGRSGYLLAMLAWQPGIVL
jgi:hypothetical protein